MEWDDLKYFLAVARCGSLTDAARALRTTPATVSRRIAVLEGKLEARLFKKTQAGYRLTEGGQAIRLKAEAVESAVFSVERTVVGRDLRPSGKVHITTTDDVGAAIVAPSLAQFRRQHPKIVLEVTTDRLLNNLTRREADIALRQVRPTEGDYVIKRVGSWDCGLYAAKSYAKSHRLKPGIQNLTNVEIITWTADSAHLRGGAWFAEHARGLPNALRSNSRRVQQAACKAGIGVAILPCLLADPDVDLVRLLPAERVVSLDLWLVVHRDLARTARVRVVMDFLATAVVEATRR